MILLGPKVADQVGQIAAFVIRALRRAPQRVVLVKGDQAVAYGRVVEAMVMLQRAGATKVGFLTDPLPSARADARTR